MKVTIFLLYLANLLIWGWTSAPKADFLSYIITLHVFPILPSFAVMLACVWVTSLIVSGGTHKQGHLQIWLERRKFDRGLKQELEDLERI